MDGIHPQTSFCFLLLVLLRASAVDICSAPQQVSFFENNTPGDVVQTISVQLGVTLQFRPPPANPDNPFGLEGNQLVALMVLDHETKRVHSVDIICTQEATGSEFPLIIIIIVGNVNDNSPFFDQNLYQVSVNEMAPVHTTVGHFFATDFDGDALQYKLSPESTGFTLKSANIPEILIESPLDYEKVKTVQLILTAQDPVMAGVTFTANTTIIVTILDGDNRPPWFQPCSKHEVGGAVVCQSAGYTGQVVLNEQQAGVLPLKPGPLHAIDGDSGINGEVRYSFLAGDAGGLFQIDPDTGNITMLKPADVLGTLSLTVLAAQTTNSYQFATTTVTVSARVKSLHRPQFQRPLYEGVVTAVGVMATDPKGELLTFLATDDDYAGTAGINPHVAYSVNGSSDFSVVGGYLFMTTELPEGALSLQLLAVDATNGETAEARLSVEVTAGLTTTSWPLSTTSLGESSTDSMTTAGESTSNPSTPTNLSTTSPSTTIVSTIETSMTSDGSASTINPSLTSEGSDSTATAAHTAPGGFGPSDMAALGATLGVLLLACLGVIVVLALRIRRADGDWKKLFEASVFQSALVQGGQKGGVQYTNEAFQNDDDGDSAGSGGPAAGSVRAGGAPGDSPSAATLSFAMPPRALPRGGIDDDDAASQGGSDSADNEDKEVRPILTKERRVDDGYKSVWFKEDIDPDAKEEVLIIPDSREDDSEEEEDEEPSSSGREDDEDGPRAVFNDADLDSGLGVKMEDPDEDEEGHEELTVHL